jgi:CRISPR-associated exonuclease Cas4
MISEDDFVPISALSHIYYCERRFALIHLEQSWEENRFTAEGKILHERVHMKHHESRRFFRQEYSMAVRSLVFGLIGKCDLVEIWYSKNKNVKKVVPIEFKRGRKKESDVDRIQLCAQILCLEEMFELPIDTGQLYYLQEHRRNEICVDNMLRKRTIALIERIRMLRDAGVTSKAEYEKHKCDNCSLVDICMPKSTGTRNKQVNKFIHTQLGIIKGICEKDIVE